MPMLDDDLYEQEQVKKQEDQPRKKKKGGGKKKLFFLFLLLLAGIFAGLHFTGAWDARPLLYRTIPSLPLIGPRLGEWLKVPEEYSLTVEERRELDLDKRQEILQEWERELQDKESLLDTLSKDLGGRESLVEARERRLAASLAEQEQEPPQDLSQENIKKLLRVYGEMSSRNAAEIMQNLSVELAVTLLSQMPQDQAAAILGKMEAPRAAYLTKELANRALPQQ